MTPHTLPTDAAPDAPDHTEARVADLLIRLERGDPRRLVLRPLADMRHTRTDTVIFATVFIDAGDGRGPEPFALHELALAAACLAIDPPFPAAPSLAPRLTAAASDAAVAAQALQRSLN